ncbi:MAG: dihydrofolate reductase [Candidatus Pacebacteria bacterium]|nr:dihydrofolate reductase [Candidatus Paceibacterota bacterium]
MQVFLIAAVTVDGLIAKDIKSPSTTWTSQADKAFFQQRTKKAGVVVMGRKTFATVGKPLPGRLNIVYSRQTRAELLGTAAKQFSKEQLQVTQAQPQQLVKQLAAQGLTELAICGGSTIYTMFMQAGVVNRLYLTVEPVIFGQGLTLFKRSLEPKLKLINSRQLNDQGTILLEYQLLKDSARN